MKDGQRVTIAESEVMGRLPILVLSTVLAVVGFGQITGTASRAIASAGGAELDYVWAITLIAAWALVVTARLWRDPREAATLEVTGIVLVIAGVATYVWAIFDGAVHDGASLWSAIEGRAMLLGLATATILNITGRAILLVRRMIWTPRLGRGDVDLDTTPPDLPPTAPRSR